MPPSTSRVASPSAPLATAVIAACLVAFAATTAAAAEPVYWRQRIFFIPYQPSEQGRFAPAIDKVQLLVARDGASQWAVLQEAEPHVRGFSYHAPTDGQYDFALRTSDRKGNLTPATITQPQLRVVVDTTPPTMNLNATLDATGRIVLRYEARDLQLRPETLRLEAQSDGADWHPLPTGPPDISQPDRVVGQVAWKPPTASGKVLFRAAIDDRAGNRGAGSADTSLVGPMLSPPVGPLLGTAAGNLHSLAPTESGPSFPAPVNSMPTAPAAAPSTAAPAPVNPALEWPSQIASSQAPATATIAAASPPGPLNQTPPPAANPYTLNPVSANPFASQATSSLAPTAPTTPSASSATSSVAPTPPPTIDPWSQPRTPAQLVGDSGAKSPASTFNIATPTMPAPPLSPFASAPPLTSSTAPTSTSTSPPRGANPFAPPPLFDGPPPLSTITPFPKPGGTSPAANAGWSSAAAPPAAEADGPRWVNALTFDVDYELQTVGPWGVSKVELWATSDNGQTWVNMGADPDNRAPMRITVPAAGLYGFRLVVTGANGAPPPNPAAGQPPELSIGVDMQPPQADLQTAELGQGNLADHLIIRWAASDENIDPRPTALFFSTEAEGPWTTIATDLENNGQYAWRLPQQLPERLFLRLEVRDKAGNLTVKQSPAPVALNLPQPTGRLRSVRPVKEPEDPSRFRTAAGPGRLPPVQ